MQGKLNGEVIVHYANGNRFKGFYANGMRNGKAIEEDKNGIRFEGNYKDDNREGEFIEKDRNGTITKKGRYERGKRIEY